MENAIEKRFLEILGKKGKANPLDITNELNLDISNDQFDSFVESLYARDIISEPHPQKRSGSLPEYDFIILPKKGKNLLRL